MDKRNVITGVWGASAFLVVAILIVLFVPTLMAGLRSGAWWGYPLLLLGLAILPAPGWVVAQGLKGRLPGTRPWYKGP